MSRPDDPWQLPHARAIVSEGDKPAVGLGVKAIHGVVALDEQRFSPTKRQVPDALHAPLFGTPDHPHQSPGAAGIPHSYAILDAAKITNLPEILGGTGLAHQCLFSGKALDEFKDLAPWIVRLDPGSTFTRNLFTQGPAARHLWDANPAIFLRSHHPIECCAQHLRKFTRLPHHDGTFYLFRFWDSEWTGALLQSYFADGLSRIFDGITTILTRQQGVFHQFWREGRDTERPIVLSETGTRSYLHLRQKRLCGQLLSHFGGLHEFATWDQRLLERRIETHVAEGLRLGLSDGADLFTFALGLCLSDRPERLRDDLIRAGTAGTNASARREAMLELARGPIALAKTRQQERLENAV